MAIFKKREDKENLKKENKAEYYLKEVPTDDLRTKILWRSSGPNMAKSYLISTLDSEVDYCRTGFIVDGENQTVDNNDIYRYIMLANGAIAGSGSSGTNVSVYVSDISNDADAVRAAIKAKNLNFYIVQIFPILFYVLFSFLHIKKRYPGSPIL